MTRRRLWLVTTACCALLALPTIGRFIGLVSTADALRTTRQLGASTVGQMHAITAWTRDAMTTAFRIARASSVWRARTVEAAVPPRGSTTPTIGLSRTASNLADRWLPNAHTALVLAAVMIALMALAVLVTDHLRQRWHAATPERARRLAEHGMSVGVIARRSGLPQDAVRQLVHPPLESDRAAFPDLLAASLNPHEGFRDAIAAVGGRAQGFPLGVGKREAGLASTTSVPGSRSNR